MEHYKPISNPPPGDHMTRNQGRKKGLSLRRNAQPSGYLINQHSNEPYYLYPPEAFRPKTPPSEKQLAALAAGRELLGSKACSTPNCKNRAWRDWQSGLPTGYCNDCKKDRNHQHIGSQVRDWLKSECIVIDTETTGLDECAEACELAVIDSQGNTLINTLIKPIRPIPDSVIRIHGITNEAVESAPSFAELMPEIQRIFAGKTILIYNAPYDLRILRQSAEAHGLEFDFSGFKSQCAMDAFARFFGEWDGYRNRFRLQKLHAAASYCGVDNQGAHRALADCKMTLGVINYMRQKAAE